MNMKKYVDLIYKKYELTLNPDEEKQLNLWMNKNPDNRKYADSIRLLLEESQQIVLPDFTDTESIWQSIQQKDIVSTAKPDLSNIVRNTLYLFRKRTMIYAISIILCIILGYGLYDIIFNPYRSIITDKGEKNTIFLSEGSSVVLNSDSRILISKTYDRAGRKVRLSGEAFFHVLPADRPFIVETDNTISTVIGTSFNIWSRNKETRIVVEQGRVKFRSNLDEAKALVVEKGQMSCIIEKGDPQDPESVDINEKLGWIKGKLVFKKTPLSEVADELERFYNIQIKITPPELGDKTITATIYELSADQAIKSICQSLQINFKKKGKTYILYNGKKQ